MNPINRPGVIFVTHKETLSIQLERKIEVYVLETDAFRNATKVVNVVYRWRQEALNIATTSPLFTSDDVRVQDTNVLLYTEQAFTNSIDTSDTHLVSFLAEVRRF